MPMKNPPHPGLSVRFDCLAPLDQSVTEAARRLGVSRKQLTLSWKSSMAETFTRWDVADHPQSKEDVRLYLEACAEEDPGDGSLIRAALNDIARAKHEPPGA